MAYLQFLGCCLVWSVSFLLMKKAVAVFHPMDVGAWRVIGGATVLGLIIAFRATSFLPTRRQFGWLSVICLVGCCWPYAIQPLVVSRQGSAFVALTVSLVPLMTLTLSALFLKEYPTRRQAIGVVGAFVCLAMLLVEGLSRSVPLGDLALAFSVPLCYAGSNLLIRRKLTGLNSLPLTFLLMTGTSLVLFPLSLIVEGPADMPDDSVWWGIASLAALGIIGTGLATFWFNSMIQSRGALFAGMSTNLVPIGALLWGWWDSETVTQLQIVALTGIVAMVVLVQYDSAVTQARKV